MGIKLIKIMKQFTTSVVILLALSAFAVYQSTTQEVSYTNRIANIAKKVNSMNSSWRAVEPSRFLEMDKTQVKKLMGALFEGKPSLKDVSDYHKFTVAAPDSFDSRTQWPKCQSLTEIRDQANCGSCWAFGAAEAMSDRICIASDQTIQTRISSQDLMTCCTSCGMGCNGGFPGAAWNYFVNTGLVTGDLYGDTNTCRPYTLAPCAHHVKSAKYPACTGEGPTPACTRKCISSYGTSYTNDKHFGSNSYSVTGVSKMESEISTHGPIEVAFSVYEDFLTYKSGVYRHTTGGFLGGHAVKAIGYGTENGQDYWMIANSWNETWGDNGYFKILKGSNECGIEGQGVAGIPKIN